jgi:hypothetical protein
LTNRFGYQLGGRQVSMTNAAGATKIALNYLDRRPASITGTAQVNEFYDYSLTDLAFNDALYPKNVTTKTLSVTNSTRWTVSATDQRYRPALEEYPAFGSLDPIVKEFNVNNPWDRGYWLTVGPVEREFGEYYDTYGQKIRQGSDDDFNGEIYADTTDRVHTFTSRF